MTTSVAAGARLGTYRIVAPLGAGGMGEVFRAHDAKLDRAVALKILPAEVVKDAERVRRFVQEARSVSSLSHPNIVTIYDIGEATPVEANSDAPAADAPKLHYIAMELVEGQTLRQLLDDRSIEPRTLLAYLAQAAEGLAKAHAAGIVHRDLKPENIMVSRDGYAKVLDFGLAKLTEPAVSGSALAAAPTALHEDNTREGAVMGTIGYMSPEQAMGKPIDHRTDLWAFGCLLYEAATGKRPFTGESSVDVLHAIVRQTPTPVEQIAPQIPRALARKIRRCLEKDPAKRAQSMKDLAFELHDLAEEWETLATPSGTVTSGSSVAGLPPARSGIGGFGRAGWIAIAVATVAVTALAATALVLWRGRSAPAPAASAFQSMQITAATSTGNSHGASISPDGRYLVYLRLEPGGTSLWLRLLATGSDVQLLPPPPQSVRHFRNPIVAPDGNYVYYSMSNDQRTLYTLYRMPVLGGASREIATDVDSRIAFSPDGQRIAFLRGDVQSSSSSLILANADGSGDETTLTTRSIKDKQLFFVGVANLGPAWSPDGRSLAVPGIDTSDKVRCEFVRVELEGGRQTRIGDTFWTGFSGLAWLPDGGALIVAGNVRGVNSQSQLWRVPLADGEPVRITNDSQYYVGASSSQDGRLLASVQGSASSTIWRRPLAGSGEERQLTFSNRETAYELVALADGSLAYSFLRGRERGIARLSGDGGDPFVLTRPGADNFSFRVSRDGGTILVLSLLENGRLVIRAMDREGGSIREITSPDESDRFELHPDGSWYLGADSKGLWRRPLDGGEPTLIVEDPAASAIGFSPDGGRLAYESSVQGGGSEVTRSFVVIPATGGAPLARVAKPDGPFFNPKWAPDGKALILRKFENRGFNLWRLPLDGSPIERLTDFVGLQFWDYAISPEGKTLYFTKGVETTDAVLIENFQ